MLFIDGDKLQAGLLDLQFPIQDQDTILDLMDKCIVQSDEAAATIKEMEGKTP